jgi:hypothetical protein
MQLFPGGLRHHVEEIDLKWEVKKCVLILLSCTPTSRWKENGVFAQRFSHAFLGLPLFQSLLPKKSEFSTMLPAASLPIKRDESP